jgi:uncharacterized protein
MNEFDAVLKLEEYIRNDLFRYSLLKIACELKLHDWCIGAGFVRNLAWDKIHQKNVCTALNDIDLVYFDNADFSRDNDQMIEIQLKNIINVNWSVKNQARMHFHNGSTKYLSTKDAMSYWPELETAVGVYLDFNEQVHFIAPFGVANLFNNTITKNNRTIDKNAFERRILEKNWVENWKQLIKIGS